MSETPTVPPVAAPPVAPVEPTVIARNLDVTYRVYADSQPKLRKLFVGDRTQREYRAVEAVKDLTFVAEPGEAIGIIGHNGSGKSTLLRAISGLVPVSGGEVYASSIPVLLGVAAALEPDISGRRNVYLGGTALGISRDHMEERFDDIVEFAGLEEFIDLPLRAYSSGMRSRLQFAIATAVTPEILMVDEALSTGDGEFKDRSDARIREMIGEAGTVFLVSHSLKSITDVCTRVLWMDHGRLIADGDPESVVAAYQAHVDKLKAANRRKRKAKAAKAAKAAEAAEAAEAADVAGTAGGVGAAGAVWTADRDPGAEADRDDGGEADRDPGAAGDGDPGAAGDGDPGAEVDRDPGAEVDRDDGGEVDRDDGGEAATDADRRAG